MKRLRKVLSVLLVGAMLWTVPLIKETYSYSKSSTKYWSEYYGKPVRKVIKRQCKIYHYTSLPEENGGYAGYCSLGKLNSKTIANNYYSLGRNIYIEGYGKKIVRDRGGKGLNSKYKLDVYVPKKKGETNSQYKKRVNDMGVKTKTCYIVYFK